MAFWALGTFQKVKKYSIGQVTKKFKGYVGTPGKEDIVLPPIQNINNKPPKQRPSQKQLMEIQLRQYKKLLELQVRITEEHDKRQREKVDERIKQMQRMNNEMIDRENEQKKSLEKDSLFRSLQSGQKSINQLIQENILLKEHLYLTSNTD